MSERLGGWADPVVDRSVNTEILCTTSSVVRIELA
ncbi:hypothetical protein X011_09785 [Mycobacterium tuberculosis variant microti OV254]|nr:hypothetical protein X011_09785 [Mycobacterium tuberculosis variant microti OV254]